MMAPPPESWPSVATSSRWTPSTSPPTFSTSWRTSVPSVPGGRILALIQDRWAQRTFVAQQDVPQPVHALVTSPGHARERVRTDRLSLRVEDHPVRLRRQGSGARTQPGGAREGLGRPRPTDRGSRGVRRFRARDLGPPRARARRGVPVLPIAENVHVHHILHTTRAPARIASEIESQARSLGRRVAAGLDYYGVMAIELFVTTDGRLLLNEIAPRPHNSAHFTFGGCATSQFEQHLRAVCAQPLGDPSPLGASVMLNLLGDLWSEREPDWEGVFRHPSGATPPLRKSGAPPRAKDGPHSGRRGGRESGRGGGDECRSAHRRHPDHPPGRDTSDDGRGTRLALVTFAASVRTSTCRRFGPRGRRAP